VGRSRVEPDGASLDAQGMQVERVAIIGCGGSGKSTLARRMGSFCRCRCIILTYRQHRRPQILRRLPELKSTARFAILDSRAAVDRFVFSALDDSATNRARLEYGGKDLD